MTRYRVEFSPDAVAHAKLISEWWRANTAACYSSPMDSATGKQQILDALRDLPEDASVEDAIERLVFLAKVREGIAELDNDQPVDHAAVKKRFGL